MLRGFIERESSFLTVSLYGKREREREREIVRRSPRCNFLTVSLYDIMYDTMKPIYIIFCTF